MKHQTINLVKFKALSKRLDLPLCWTVGLLEGLWLFACHNARDGKLHRFSALELAGWLEYPGGEKEMVDALVETRWLDRDIDGHLLIHDWDEHKPNWLKGLEAQPHKSQPGSELGKEPSTVPSTEPSTALGTGPPNQTKPNQTFPNETKRNPPPPNPPCPEPEPLSGGWLEAVAELNSLGMDHPELALTAARERGCTTTEAMNQIRHFKSMPGAWGIGLLYKILEHLRPDKKVSWPEPCPEFAKAKSREYSERLQNETLRARANGQQLREQNRLEREQLEKDFGAKLDAIGKPKLRELVEKVCPLLLSEVPKRGRTEGLLREQLLLHLKSGAA